MIIFGTRVRRQELNAGEFYCPQCRAQEPYKHMRARNYFALYFIPIIPLGGGTEYVHCTHCNSDFELGVLNVRPPTAAERRVQTVRPELRSGIPLQMAWRKLVNSGVPESEAREAVLAGCSVTYRECPQCGLTYHESIAKCSQCGRDLRPSMTPGL